MPAIPPNRNPVPNTPKLALKRSKLSTSKEMIVNISATTIRLVFRGYILFGMKFGILNRVFKLINRSN